MKKQRPFLLLELLIALTLCTICIPLFVKNPLLFLNKEKTSLENMELQRCAENSFCTLKTLLYKNTINWNSLSLKRKEASYVENETPIKISFPQTTPKLYREKYKLWTIEEKKEEKSNKVARRVGIELIFTPVEKKGNKEKKKFLYEVCALSIPKEIAPTQMIPLHEKKKTASDSS